MTVSKCPERAETTTHRKHYPKLTMATARIFDGAAWTDITDSEAVHTVDHAQVAPILDGDGNIFVSIPTFRDGGRCGKTLIDMFAKAKDPDKVFVGLIEQNTEDEMHCIEAYCEELGVKIYKKNKIRADTTKVIALERKSTCPHIDQIRKVQIHNISAKGPNYARSLAHKVLGNEEFCMQIDAHMEFVMDWDMKLKQEWANTGNEFGIISTVPTGLGDKGDVSVPRMCAVEFQDIGAPAYRARGDGKVENLKKPLLSHAWSSGFSFAKCHLEESAPYDPFTPYISGIEQFSRYARFWTRGYDVYTPTQNIVFHNYQPNPDGHGVSEWMKPRYQRKRKASIERIKAYLNLSEGENNMNLANLGIYGLGKRRTMKQLSDFVGLDMEHQKGRSPTAPCANHQWVPYDTNISPVVNLFDKPDDLDPQPEYPLRSELVYYKQEDEAAPNLNVLEGEVMPRAQGRGGGVPQIPQPASIEGVQTSPFPSFTLLLALWVFGLVMWCMTFMNRGARGGAGGKRARKSNPSSYKDK